jgi:hypothetical protein
VDNWKIEIGSNMEMKVKDGPTYCAHPKYHNEGPWQDWANVSFGRDEHGLLQMVPLRIFLFYNHHFLMTMEARRVKSVGNDHTRQQPMDETYLCSQWQLSMKHGSSQDKV